MTKYNSLVTNNPAEIRDKIRKYRDTQFTSAISSIGTLKYNELKLMEERLNLEKERKKSAIVQQRERNRKSLCSTNRKPTRENKKTHLGISKSEVDIISRFGEGIHEKEPFFYENPLFNKKQSQKAMFVPSFESKKNV